MKFCNRRFFEVSLGAFREADPRRVRRIREGGFKVEVFHEDLEAYKRFLEDEGIDILHFVRGGDEDSQLIQSSVPIKVDLNVFGLYNRGPVDQLIDRHLLQSKTVALRYLASSGLSMDAFLRRNRVQYVPIDIDRFDELIPSDGRRASLKRKLDLEDEAPILCRVARPDLWKWSFFLLHAFSLVLDKIPAARLVLIGGVPRPVKFHIEKWGLQRHVRIMNAIPDDEVIEMLHLADVMTHTSHIGETFGAAIAQGMAAKKPVVVNSTDWADNSQIELVDNKRTGFVANTPKSYADAVVYLLKNKDAARKMGLNGYAKAKSQYHAPRVTTSLEKSFAELAHEKRISDDVEMTTFYKSVDYLPTVPEISSWPSEYGRRLRESGYTLTPFQRYLVRRAWMGFNTSETLRSLRIPKFLMRHDSPLSYLAAIT